mmetsp:Transcript_36489/g.105114  ORF Transcript_36489/g.105114 Transcript_36489/m.105114 type:complete len:80 (-) Transcript_36489:29-268(-)
MQPYKDTEAFYAEVHGASTKQIRGCALAVMWEVLADLKFRYDGLKVILASSHFSQSLDVQTVHATAHEAVLPGGNALGS